MCVDVRELIGYFWWILIYWIKEDEICNWIVCAVSVALGKQSGVNQDFRYEYVILCI